MNHPIVRGVVAVVVGIIGAGLVVMALELMSAMLYPMPGGLDRNRLGQYIANLPAGAFAIVLGAWTAAAFLGVWAATRIARSWIAGVVVGLLFLGACVANLMTIPHPIWFSAAGLVMVIVSGAVALRLGSPARTMRAA